jgi:hypothetical protein
MPMRIGSDTSAHTVTATGRREILACRVTPDLSSVIVMLKRREDAIRQGTESIRPAASTILSGYHSNIEMIQPATRGA